MLYINALDSAPLVETEKIQFFLPITNGFIDLSAELLSISSAPSSKKNLKF